MLVKIKRMGAKHMSKIDRKALVRRHNPVVNKIDPNSPLSIGNGEFAFTVDITGLQTFEDQYILPLGTQSQWGWHSFPHPSGIDPTQLKPKEVESHGRKVGYFISEKGQEEVFHYLRENPHRAQLGQIGFRILLKSGEESQPEDIQNVSQTLDLWTGIITTTFEVEGETVEVTTICHPEVDTVSVSIRSELISQGRLELKMTFPAPHPTISHHVDDDSHETAVEIKDRYAQFHRQMDEDEYFTTASWESEGNLIQKSKHLFLIQPGEASQDFEATFSFQLDEPNREQLSFQEVKQRSVSYWKSFWESGGAVELNDSTDPRAFELERRIVLSQFLTAIHCSGSIPPQETGLIYNSWFGKFHLEMHWWHAFHFVLWGRTHLLERSFDWYKDILPEAKKIAERQGYKGVRWPKMVGPEGVDSPSPVGPLLIWQQPHPIMFAEMLYKENPTKETLEKYEEIVVETADFMADFASWDEENKRYVLGPPVIPAQENHKGETTCNPTFELAYWRYGLNVAIQWCERLDNPVNEKWKQVVEHLSEFPIYDDLYQAHENETKTFTTKNRDHPNMIAALGILNDPNIDHEIMRNTLLKILETWQWETSWGWDFPVVAMTAARLSEPDIAVDALLMDTIKNTYLDNGHNWQREGLFIYLPGNGALLTAVALMAAGWEGAEVNGIGFPKDGSWTVKSEGLRAWL